MDTRSVSDTLTPTARSFLPRACSTLVVLLPAARSIGDAMPDYKDLSCDGGYEVAAIDEVPRGLRGTAPRRSCRRFDSRTTRLRRLLLLVALTTSTALVLAAAPAGSGTAGPLVQSSGRPAADDICTMASVEQRATIEVRIAHAEDFCELLSQALAIVFRTRPFVTLGVLWHYAESAPSCRLRFRSTRHRMVVHNSMRTCRWFARHASGWRAEAGPGWPSTSRPPESMDTRLGPDTAQSPPLARLPRACPPLVVLLPAARSIGDAMPADDTVLSCECGYEVTATHEADLIEEIRRHARDVHGVAFSIEDALLVVLRSELEPESFSTSTHRREE